MGTEIQAIIFDLGDVLLDLDREAPKQYYQQYTGAAFGEWEARKQIQELYLQYELGAMEEPEYLGQLQNLSPGDASQQELADAWNSMLHLGIPAHRLQFLEALKAKFPLYLLSNTNHTHLTWIRQHLVEAHQISDFDGHFFQKAYYSHLIKMRKPNAEIYEFVLEDAGLQAASTLFIDDTPVNIEAANELGIQTILFDKGRMELRDVVSDFLG